MPRPKKDGISLNLKIDKEIYNELTEFSEECGQTKTFIVEKALKEYMSKYNEFRKALKERN